MDAIRNQTARTRHRSTFLSGAQLLWWDTPSSLPHSFRHLIWAWLPAERNSTSWGIWFQQSTRKDNWRRETGHYWTISSFYYIPRNQSSWIIEATPQEITPSESLPGRSTSLLTRNLTFIKTLGQFTAANWLFTSVGETTERVPDQATVGTESDWPAAAPTDATLSTWTFLWITIHV